MGIGYEDDKRRDKSVEGLPFGSDEGGKNTGGFPPLTRILSAFYKIDDREEVVKYGTPGRPVIRGRFAPTFGANYFAPATYAPRMFSKLNIIRVRTIFVRGGLLFIVWLSIIFN